MRYKLTIAYDGTDFCGWQKQEPPEPIATGEAIANGAPTVSRAAFSETTPQLPSQRPGRLALRTVQAVVERAVRHVVRENIQLLGASRTDAGVHAQCQTAAFSCSPRDDLPPEQTGSGWPAERGTDRLMLAINGQLPEDVRIVRAEQVQHGFDPIGDTLAKGYRYTLVRAMQAPLWERRYVYHIQRRDALDTAAMAAAAAELVGTHDFAAFAAAGHGRLSTIRRVDHCAVSAVPLADGSGERIELDISGNGFLWNMVRIIAGTLVDVGLRRRTAEHVRQALADQDRRKAGPTLGPQGLCLMWIEYPTIEPPAAL